LSKQRASYAHISGSVSRTWARTVCFGSHSFVLQGGIPDLNETRSPQHSDRFVGTPYHQLRRSFLHIIPSTARTTFAATTIYINIYGSFLSLECSGKARDRLRTFVTHWFQRITPIPSILEAWSLRRLNESYSTVRPLKYHRYIYGSNQGHNRVID
jgi:hypothetical protein